MARRLVSDFRDVLERSWTLATVQIDCDARAVWAGICYPEGHNATPVMLHRAVLGSIERFIAILLEHCGEICPSGSLPCR
jgi:threonyl-tRNA synthetase